MSYTDKPCEILVIGGGENGGKSSSEPTRIEAAYKGDRTPIFLPEAATVLFNAGIDFRNGSISMPEFQRHLIELQLTLEEIAKETARQMIKNGLKPLIYCDRGIPDGEIYLGREAYKKLLAEFNLSPDEVVHRYSAMFHMVSVADGRPELYVQTKTRKQTVKEAYLNDHLLRKVWLGVEHFHLITNEGTFEQKLKTLEGKILHTLGKPEPIERERKFLILLSDLEKLADQRHMRVLGIEQRYIHTEAKGRQRVRKLFSLEEPLVGRGVGYFLTTKHPKNSPQERIEITSNLSKDEYGILATFQRPSTRHIEKHRHYFLEDKMYFEVDTFINIKLPYHKEIPFGLRTAMVEVEFTEEELDIQKPDWAEYWVEVTEDDRYYNSSLAVIK